MCPRYPACYRRSARISTWTRPSPDWSRNSSRTADSRVIQLWSASTVSPRSTARRASEGDDQQGGEVPVDALGHHPTRELHVAGGEVEAARVLHLDAGEGGGEGEEEHQGVGVADQAGLHRVGGPRLLPPAGEEGVDLGLGRSPLERGELLVEGVQDPHDPGTIHERRRESTLGACWPGAARRGTSSPPRPRSRRSACRRGRSRWRGRWEGRGPFPGPRPGW
jgi:hypothetical protein